MKHLLGPVSRPDPEPTPGTPELIGTGSAFGTFGELLQGVLPDGDRNFLVTFPIATWARATFQPRADRIGVRVVPPHKEKSRRVAQLLLDVLGERIGGVLELGGDLPEGKGLASSSADLVASARAVASALGRDLDESMIESLLRQVEPSDGVMYDEVVVYHHTEVRLAARLGELPRLAVVAHDEGGQVDTVMYNDLPKPFSDNDKHEYRQLLDDLVRAVTDGDLVALGRITTRSAVMNAKVRPCRSLETMQTLCRAVDGYGLVIAHSGTMLGILLDAEDPALPAKVDQVRVGCAPLGGDVVVYRSLGLGDSWVPGVPGASGVPGVPGSEPGPRPA